MAIFFLTSMRGVAVAGLLMVALLGGAGIGYLVENSSQRVVTSVSVTTTTAYLASETTVPSLELFAWLTPSIVAEGQNVTVVAEVYNPTAFIVTVSTPSFDNPAYGPCGQDFATGVNVYAGHYTFANISGASPLTLYGPGPYLCPPVSNFQYAFEPNSAFATIQPSSGGQAGSGGRIVNETSVFSGYWSGGSSLAFHAFGKGQYSVVVFDAWGQQAMEYFQVT